MSKYIDAEKLISEIRKESDKEGDGDAYDAGYDAACLHILLLIRSLQKEQPEVDLEKEIRDTCRGYRINDYHEQELGKQDIENIARHFYELGLNAKKK